MSKPSHFRELKGEQIPSDFKNTCKTCRHCYNLACNFHNFPLKTVLNKKVTETEEMEKDDWGRDFPVIKQRVEETYLEIIGICDEYEQERMFV